MKIENLTDLEALALSQNKRFWKTIDDSIAREKQKGFVNLADLPRLPPGFPKRIRDKPPEKADPF
jgi:hypothetical protein